MKTTAFSHTSPLRAIGLFSLLLICLIAFSPMIAQNAAQGKTIKGVVTTEEGPLYGANIILKGSDVGTTTNENGEFTFPRALSASDVLVISYLGYEKQEIRITANKTYYEIKMTDDLVEILGAPASEKPYKSKRQKHKA